MVSEDAILAVKSSDVRERILRNLYYRDERARPSKVLEAIGDEMETSSGNFYMNLNRLVEEGMVEKMEGDNRATLYWLTEKGEEVAGELENEWEGTGTGSPGSADPAPGREVDPEFVEALQTWLGKWSQGPDEVILAAERIKQNR